MIDRRVPPHLLVLVGMSAGVYAAALAGVTTLQSGADARLIAQRAPFQLAAERAADANDGLERAVDQAARRYAILADRYGDVGDGLGDIEAALDGLAERAATLTETTASLPTRIALPRMTVPQVVARPRSSPPKTHGTTGASG